MMVLNFPVLFDFFCWGLYILVLFCRCGFVTGYYILNLRFYCGVSAAIMGILVAVTTYQPLMNVRLLLIGILNYGILQL
jgi:hypothetical protein